MLTERRSPKSSLEAVNKMLEAIHSMLPELEPDVQEAVLTHASLCSSLTEFTNGLDSIRHDLSARFKGRIAELS